MARIAFCQNVPTEYMGFMYIAAVLKEAGHTVEIFLETLNESAFLEEVVSYNPDIVGFSVLTPGKPWTIKVARAIKEKIDAIIKVGNVEAMLGPEIIEEPGIDIVCRGEGEYPMKELANCVDNALDYSNILGLWIKTPDGIIKNPLPDKLVDLDTLPYHDRTIYDKYRLFRHAGYLKIMNGRGCPFNCSFCLNPVIGKHLDKKAYVRKRSPELAIREIEYQVKMRGKKQSIFLFHTKFSGCPING